MNEYTDPILFIFASSVARLRSCTDTSGTSLDPSGPTTSIRLKELYKLGEGFSILPMNWALKITPADNIEFTIR